MVFASSSDDGDFAVTGLSGHLPGSLNEDGPFQRSSALVTWPPRLSRSAGLSEVGPYLQCISGCFLILQLGLQQIGDAGRFPVSNAGPPCFRRLWAQANL